MEPASKPARSGPALEGTRRALTAEWQAIAAILKPLSTRLVGTMPTYARGIMRNANLLMKAACIEVLEWPDVWLAHDLHFGMHAAGNRSEEEPGMRDTRVFRAHERPAAYSLADLCAGRARPLRARLIQRARALLPLSSVSGPGLHHVGADVADPRAHVALNRL